MNNFYVNLRLLSAVHDAPENGFDYDPSDADVPEEGEEDEFPFRHPYLELFHWAPTGNAYAFVYKNNVYYKPSVKSDKVFPVTVDGEPRVIFNGVPDWVYEGNLHNE